MYFDPGFLPEKPKAAREDQASRPRLSKEAAPSAPAPAPREERSPERAASSQGPVRPVVRASAVFGDAKATFGSFLRALRKTARNGVLFTLCMDLDSVYENDKFVLYTESETIYSSLTKEDHRALVEQAFAAIGLTDFEIRLRGKKGDDFNRSLSELKEKFSDVKIDIK